MFKPPGTSFFSPGLGGFGGFGLGGLGFTGLSLYSVTSIIAVLIKGFSWVISLTSKLYLSLSPISAVSGWVMLIE